jgi:hypothetical protein
MLIVTHNYDPCNLSNTSLFIVTILLKEVHGWFNTLFKSRKL